MRSMNKAASNIKSEALVEQFGQILLFVQEAYQQGGTAHEVECGLWQRMLKLGRDLFQAWLDLFGAGEAGDRIVLADGREVGRLADLHRREIQNVYGAFELMRAVYGTRAGQKIEAVPLDERRQLPPGKNSYWLQDWDQGLTVQMPSLPAREVRSARRVVRGRRRARAYRRSGEGADRSRSQRRRYASAPDTPVRAKGSGSINSEP